LYLWCFLHLQLQHPALLIILSIFAGITHTLKVEGATARSSYQISWIAYGASFVLLTPSETMIVLIVAHAAEWFWHRSPWYIALFNLTAFGIVATVASLIWQLISGDSTPFTPISALAFLIAAAGFTVMNHLMVGLVIWLARGENLMRSGVFNLLTLMIDFISFGMGIASGLIWLVNPYAVIFILSPLYLIYTTLQVPSLQHQTRLEPKTGLYNTRFFSETFENELERADKFDRPLTVVMADVDLLRNINNNYGHLAGDTVLIGIANTLREFVRDYDIVARFGGEEYAILLPETTLEQALPLIEQLRQNVAAAQYEVSTSVTPLSVTMSFGVAQREAQGQSTEQILHNADLAVYRSKSTTRNRVCFYDNGEIKDYSQGEVPTIQPEELGEDHLPNKIPQLISVTKQQRATAFATATTLPSQLNSMPQVAPPKTPVVTADAAAIVQEKQLGKQSKAEKDHTCTTVSKLNWAVMAYVSTMTAATLALLLWTFTYDIPINWAGIAVFAGLALFTEWLAIDIYTRNTSVSTSVAPLIAGACLFGAPGALVLSFALSTAAMIKHRSPLIRFVFNMSNHLLGGLICINFLYWLDLMVVSHTSLSSAMGVIAAAGLTYISTTALMTGVIYLDSGVPLRRIWSERFDWLWPYYIALGLVAYALAIGYLNSGIIGVTIFFVPLLMLRISQNQYLSRTESMVLQLRAVNAELVERSDQISAMNDGLILALSHVSDLRDPYVHGHAKHVARYAVLIAKEIGLNSKQIEAIRQAALLHDIGKIGIPESILFKPSRLTAEEYGLTKQHAALGAALIQEIDSLQHLAPFIRYHHEHYNGKGYPDGLGGETIPLEARILGVADAVEAMASDRPYRHALTATDILAELQVHAGDQFDPNVVEAFTKVIGLQGETLIVNSARTISRIIEEHSCDPVAQEADTATMEQNDIKSSENPVHSELDSMNIALQRAIAAHRRMEVNAQEGRDLAETLLKIATTINMTLDHNRVLTVILEQLAYVMDYDNASIMLLDGTMLNSVARRSIHVPESQSLSVPVQKLGHIQEVIEGQRAVVISDTHDDPRWMRRAGSEQIRCWLGIPLMVQNHIIGLMNLSNGVPGYYTERHVQVATAFAAHAAIAIENARLFTQAQNELAERQRAEEALRQSQEHLQAELVERMRAERALQEERALLAQRVDERTRELKTANEQLTSALRTKDEFLATMSHELRTPLNAILLLSESMQNGVYGLIEERQVGVLDNVKQSARHLLSLINDILDMSKIEAGMFEIDKGPVSVVAICRNSLGIIEESARGKTIQLVHHIDERIDTVNGDERRLAQILVNLLSNAVKFTPDGGTVGLEVTGDIQAELIHFTVWDTGIGIAKEDMKRLFQPFVQLDSKLSRLYEGTGLGLALVDRLAQLHGGTVALESEVGKGSRFTVSIPWQEEEDDLMALALNLLGGDRKFEIPPVKDDAVATVAPIDETASGETLDEWMEEEWLVSLGLDTLAASELRSAAHATGNGHHNGQNGKRSEELNGKPGADSNGTHHQDVTAQEDSTKDKQPLVLLVEDNEIGVEAMRDYLTANDYRVIVAQNGEEAIAMSIQHEPDLILMDVQMPDMDGLEATSRIRTNPKHAQTPIIALTALAMPGDRERCLHAGVNEYLSKPVSMKHLLQVMAIQLAHHQVH